MADILHNVESKIGYHFIDPSILWEALQAAGSNVRQISDRRLPDGNKRLALLGDAVLKLALLVEWYDGEEPKGRGQQMLSNVGSNANLNTIGRQNGLDPFINNDPSCRGSVSPATMASTVEAIIDAVYCDSGMQAVQRVMQTLGLTPD